LSPDTSNHKNKIPSLAITKLNSPKVAVNNEIFNPPAKIAGSGFPIASTKSNAVIKPISFERLEKHFIIILKSMEKTQKLAPITIETDFIFMRSNRKMIKLDYDAIIYSESYSDYLKICIMNSIIITRETINSIEAKLPKHTFLRIHRSYIISITHIQSFTNKYITINNQTLSISRSYKKEAIKKLEKFQ